MTDTTEHGGTPAATPPAPLAVPCGPPAPRRTPAEEARTLVASTTQGVLASLTDAGDPWGSVVTYGPLDDGSPVLLVSLMAEHTRNLLGDPRASLVVAEPPNADNPLDRGRVTLSGRVIEPTGEARTAARSAHLAAMPSASLYVDFDDFRLFALHADRVRWVGGYGRMDSVDPEAFAAAEPDPVARAADKAVAHLNADHGDALLEIARVLTGFTDAADARCERLDRYAMDLVVQTPRGTARPRVGWPERVDTPDGLRAASVALVRLARGA